MTQANIDTSRRPLSSNGKSRVSYPHWPPIEIYAGIDAYSRMIIWCYVGISARTAVSVVHQYLTTVRSIKRIPRFFRSDRGTETVLIAGAHHQLHRLENPDITLPECYIYGTSTENSRIASWWSVVTSVKVFAFPVARKLDPRCLDR
jgi:hypothetical protein